MLLGYYCVPELVTAGDPTSAKTACPMGFFCPNGTGWDWQSCPAGTYSNTTGLQKAEDCTPCEAGQYCQGNRLKRRGVFCLRKIFFEQCQLKKVFCLKH